MLQWYLFQVETSIFTQSPPRVLCTSFRPNHGAYTGSFLLQSLVPFVLAVISGNLVRLGCELYERLVAEKDVTHPRETWAGARQVLWSAESAASRHPDCRPSTSVFQEAAGPPAPAVTLNGCPCGIIVYFQLSVVFSDFVLKLTVKAMVLQV